MSTKETSTTSSSWTEAQMEQVKSMLHDRQQCATVTGLCHELHISPTTASSMLQTIIAAQDNNDSSQWHATVCQSEQTSETHGNDETIPCTVFRLSTRKLDNDEKPNEDGFLVALSTGEEVYSTAHERTLAHIRDSKDYHFPAALACDVIYPSAAVQALMDQRPVATTAVPETALEAPRVATKATTAAAFFGKKKESDKPASKVSTKSSSTKTTTATTKSKSSSKPTVPSMFQRAATSNNNNKPKTKVQQDEKENNKRPKTVGNADDFVADEEESDEEEVVTKPAIVRGRAAPSDDQVMVDIEDDKDEEMKEEQDKAKPTIYGAMDDFAKPMEKPAPDATKRRRRRKKLVTKTSTDKNGYLHTETQEVWEDIPTDEEEEEKEAPKKAKPAPSRPKKKVVKPSGMKQGNLTSFFKPK